MNLLVSTEHYQQPVMSKPVMQHCLADQRPPQHLQDLPTAHAANGGPAAVAATVKPLLCTVSHLQQEASVTHKEDQHLDTMPGSDGSCIAHLGELVT